jgi:D-alanyl-lipoteichoic acid acyltransferase DltB (MBOAT superfamily)
MVMKKIERNYLICSVLLFIWALFLLDYTPYGHGIDLYVILFGLITFGFIISGIALTIGARKKRIIFWMLLVATLMAISYIAIPYLARHVCRPPIKELEYPLPPPLNPLERIWKHCF